MLLDLWPLVTFQRGCVGACYEVFEERGSLCFGVVIMVTKALAPSTLRLLSTM